MEIKSKQDIDAEFEQSDTVYDELLARFQVAAEGMCNLDPRLGKSDQQAKRGLASVEPSTYGFTGSTSFVSVSLLEEQTLLCDAVDLWLAACESATPR